MRNTVKLGDVLKTGAGGTPLKSKKNYYEGGSIKWLLSGAVCEKDIYDCNTHITQEGLANSSAKLFPKNTVLVAMYGATAGQVGILRTEAATNQAVCGIYPSTDYLPEFLYYYLSNYKDTLLLEVSGVAQPNLSQVKIKNIPLPCIPIVEQQRIVAKLDAAFAQIDEAISITKNELDKSCLIFIQHLKKSLSINKHNWETTKLADLSKQITDGKHGDCRNQTDSGYYFLSAKDIKNDTLNYENAREIDKDDFIETHRRTNLEPNDILITNSGTIGRMAIAPIDERTQKTTFQKSVAIVKPEHSKISSSFLFFALKNQVKAFQNISLGTAQKNLLLRDIRDFIITYPKSLEEQKLMTENFLKVDKNCTYLIETYTEKLKQLHILKSSILTQELQSEAA